MHLYGAQHTLQGVLDDGDDTLKLFRGEVTGALAKIDIGLLADQVGVAATDTLDLGQGVHDLLLSIDVRVQQTDDVLEAVDVSIVAQYSPGAPKIVDIALLASMHDGLGSHLPSVPEACRVRPVQSCSAMSPRQQRDPIPTDNSINKLLVPEEDENPQTCIFGCDGFVGVGSATANSRVLRAGVVLNTYFDFSPETSAVLRSV